MQITQRATPAVYRMLSRGCRGGFPCLHIPRKAVSELYREKIESLQAEAQAETERQAMLDRTEKDCDILRAAAMARMDGAVDYLLEKVVKR